MTQEQFNELCIDTEHGTFRPSYTYDDFVFNEDIKDYEYIGLVIHKSAQEVYDEWLANKDKPPIIEEDKITILKEEVKRLTIENDSLKYRIDATENAVMDLMLTGYKA